MNVKDNEKLGMICIPKFFKKRTGVDLIPQDAQMRIVGVKRGVYVVAFCNGTGEKYFINKEDVIIL